MVQNKSLTIFHQKYKWKKFGKLTICSHAWSEKGVGLYLCKCDCGTIKTYRGCNVISGNTISCWCINRPNHSSKTNQMEYYILKSAQHRCENCSDPRYKDYGGRWIQYKLTYDTLINCIGRRPSMKHTLDRIDNHGNYEPWNIKWSTKKEQSRNMRTNVKYLYKWGIQTLSEISEKIWVKASTLRYRIKRWWSLEKALSTPTLLSWSTKK